ncbi:uncharacterized protein LOC131878967 [Tigriopus californicus]|uniref:uncharacterized protein LOC131878967 n=1 Tax=Tigriopus californicus TaxID=6832 RepID=UPI0027D9F7F4|nr:uncharacterized protein LOC131878967 [Tigriopus californicus]
MISFKPHLQFQWLFVMVCALSFNVDGCKFSCQNDDQCLSIYRVCDGRKDCDNGRDEEDCEKYECLSNQVKCQDGLQCIRSSLMCAGSQPYCQDGSDSNRTHCTQFECPPKHRKCLNGWQCVSDRKFCNKQARGRGQYQCLDRSDETVWGCHQVNKTCDKQNKLWPCQSGNSSAHCIAMTKVCDGQEGLGTNNCEGPEDELDEFCRTWPCPQNYLKCGDSRQCILAGNICDGHPHCADGSDEVTIQIRPDVWDSCQEKGSLCLKYPQGHNWKIKGEPGARCDPETCLEVTKFCDGTCDCRSNCFDEDPQFCQDWHCAEGYFKCHSSGLCIREDQLCDGNFDCGTDSSDESDCPCLQHDSSVYFRDLLVPFLAQDCGSISLDCHCLRSATIDAKVDSGSKLVYLGIAPCGLENCSLATVELDFKDPAIKCQPHKRHLSLEETWQTTGGYEAKVSLPLALEGYTYVVKTENSTEPRLSCLTTRALASEMEERIFSQMLEPNQTTAASCQCNFSRIGRIGFFNEYKLPSSFHVDTRDYFYNVVYKTVGQNELLYTTDPNCIFHGSHIHWNQVYPTIFYGTGHQTEKDNKNFPLNLFLYHPNWYCEAPLDKVKLNLLTLMSFARSGKMKTKENNPWLTLSETDQLFLEAAICELDSQTFEYNYNGSVVTYLIMAKKSPKMSTNFTIANQRLDLYALHKLPDLNITKVINILVDSWDGWTLPKVANAKLLHELFVEQRHNNSLQNFVFSRLLLPRKVRDYVQTIGYTNLNDALRKNDVKTDLTFFRVCDQESCDLDPIRDPSHIQKSLSARWSRNCLNVDIGMDSFAIQASKVDTYYIIIDMNDTKLTSDPQQVTDQVDVHIKPLLGDGRDSPFYPQTNLVEVDGQIFCTNDKITIFPSFYVSTLVSALIHNNSQCVNELCDYQELYFEVDEFSFLGPFNAIWESHCFEEFGFELISDIFESKDQGVLTINKFWAFEHFNYMIFSKTRETKHVESTYLSGHIFALEIALGTLMSSICLIAIFGNLAVFLAIMIDPTAKKTIYQYLQMSLCLADVLMGLAGAGSIVFTQFGLLFGRVTINDFIEADAFTASFKSPEQAQRSGLNQFYFITSNVSLVLCGALVSLSTTVSLLLLSAMAFTRYQVASSSFRQHRIFSWATKHPGIASSLPWFVGLTFTSLHFFDIFSMQLTFQAFFDPISKLTILLPSSTRPLNFYIQTSIGGMVSLVTIWYSIKAWKEINKNAKEIQERGMISQQDQMQRRLKEERSWMHLTAAIIIGFVISVVPVFIFYMLSIFSIACPPVVQLFVWWLLVSGSFLNLIIYTFLNKKMKRSLLLSWRHVVLRVRSIYVNASDSSDSQMGLPDFRRMSSGVTQVTRATELESKLR